MMKQSIGERITVSKKDTETIIRIEGTVEGWMNHALLGWVVMWSFLGLYVIYYLVSGKAEGERFFFFLSYIMFWGYFEYKAIYGWLFKTKGYELIKVAPDALYIKRALFSYGKVQRYVRENINELRKLDQYDRSLAAVYNKSFWVIGNEQIVFEYLGKNVGFGMHLNETDAKALLQIVRKTLKKK